MENKDLQTEIVNAAAEKAAAATNEALETKATAIESQLETKANTEDVLSLAKAVDQLSEKMSNPTFGISKKRDNMGEMTESIKEKMASLKSTGDTFTIKTEDFGVNLLQKDFGITAGSDDYQAYREGGNLAIQHDPNHQTRLLNFVQTFQLPGTGAIRYNQESARTDNAAGKAIGASLGESSYTVQPVTEGAVTAGAFQTIPNEWLDEVDMIRGYINQRMMGDLMDVIDSYIVGGSSDSNKWNGLKDHVASANKLDDSTTADAFFTDNVTDSSIDTANNYDALIATAAELEADNFRPNMVFLNPLDYRAFSWIKGADEKSYLINQAMAAGQPWAYFGGLQIVPNAAVPVGDYLLFDSSAFAVFLQKGVTLEFGLSGTDFASNNITARAMVRGGGAGLRPNGIVEGDFSIVKTAISS